MILDSHLLYICPSISCQAWTTCHSGSRELRLDKYFLHPILLIFKFIIHLCQVVHEDSMTYHLQRINFPALYHFQKLLPVQVDWGLAITNEPNTSLHKSTNIEMIGLYSLIQQSAIGISTYEANINTSDTTAAVIPNRCDHLVHNLRGVGLHSKHYFEVVCPAFGILASDALKSYVWTSESKVSIILLSETLYMMNYLPSTISFNFEVTVVPFGSVLKSIVSTFGYLDLT